MVYHVQFPGLGLDLTVNRVALAIGGFNIYWYGVIIAAGMLLAMLYAFRNAVDYGIDSDRLVDVVAIGTVMAIVCARIYYVAMAPFAYQSLWEMIDIRKGGIAIYGAVIGAFVFGGLAAKWRKVPLLPLFDLVSLGFLIGQGIGRWGNFVNQEAFGTNTTLPWGMYSEGTEAYLKSVQVTLPAGVTVDPAAPVHPTFLYESIWCLVGLGVLASLYKKRRFNGQIFLGYIIWYGLGRAWIEGLRTDSLLIGNTGLRASQLVAIGSVIVAATRMAIGLRNAEGKPLMVPLAVKDLKKQGVWVFGTAANGTTGLYDADLKGAAAIVIGSEGDGMTRLAAENCDFLVSIPMKGDLNSLNASASAAILLYEAVRQRL